MRLGPHVLRGLVQYMFTRECRALAETGQSPGWVENGGVFIADNEASTRMQPSYPIASEKSDRFHSL